MTLGLRQFLSWFFWVLEWIALAALACVCYALDVELPDADQKSIFLQALVAWVQESATWLGVGLACFIVVTRFSRWGFQGKSREAEILDRLTTEALDEFREKCFPDLANRVPKDHNRVTVFKHSLYVWWIWPFRGWLTPWGLPRFPCSGWLIIRQRSGHLTQSPGTAFLAPDDAQHCEGVAGQAWRRRAYRVGTKDRKLPNLRNVKYTGHMRACCWRLRRRLWGSTPEIDAFVESCEQVRQYAETTHCATRFVWQRIKRRRPCPTSILAVPLLDKNKEPWGVLVMDSCNEVVCIDSDSPKFRTAFKNLQTLMHSCGMMDE